MIIMNIMEMLGIITIIAIGFAIHCLMCEDITLWSGRQIHWIWRVLLIKLLLAVVFAAIMGY